MHVIIIGAGEVGVYLAKRLQYEGVDVAMIELDPIKAAKVSNKLDIQVVVGSGSSPVALKEAGIEKADILAAVTQNDEVNLVASLLAKENNVATTVVRVEADELHKKDAANLLQAAGVDILIDPDAETADEILTLIGANGAKEFYQMSASQLIVLGATVTEEAPLAQQALTSIYASADNAFLVGTITRDEKTIIPRGDEKLLPGDHVRVLCQRSDQIRLLQLLGVTAKKARRVMILGGGAVAERLAGRLCSAGIEVTVIEKDSDRADALARRLEKAMVICGDITDTELLLQESVGEADVVIATTGEDASNVLACGFAATEGTHFTVAVIHRLDLLAMVKRFGVDASLSPRKASANAVLRQIRKGNVHSILESDVEIDEFIIGPDSELDRHSLADISLPKNLLIGAVTTRNGISSIANDQTEINAGDTVIVFGTSKAVSRLRPKLGS